MSGVLRSSVGLFLARCLPFRDFPQHLGLPSREHLALGSVGDHDLEDRFGWRVSPLATNTAWGLLGWVVSGHVLVMAPRLVSCEDGNLVHSHVLMICPWRCVSVLADCRRAGAVGCIRILRRTRTAAAPVATVRTT